MVTPILYDNPDSPDDSTLKYGRYWSYGWFFNFSNSILKSQSLTSVASFHDSLGTRLFHLHQTPSHLLLDTLASYLVHAVFFIPIQNLKSVCTLSKTKVVAKGAFLSPPIHAVMLSKKHQRSSTVQEEGPTNEGRHHFHLLLLHEQAYDKRGIGESLHALN